MITKAATDFSNLNFETGESILIDKPIYWTSFRVVHTIRKAIGGFKVGHAGTLDPNATGLLILCTGKKTKMIDNFQGMDKTYEGTFTLGIKTPSMDEETEVTEEKPFDFVTDEMINETKKIFCGDIYQTPPIYSAINFEGKKLYHYARKGKFIHLEPRLVSIFSFEISKIELPKIYFKINCSKGTYIRAVANDFGDKLGCGAVLSSLRRLKIGGYSVDDALSVSEFVNLNMTSKVSNKVN